MMRRSFLGMPALAMLQAPLAAARAWQAARHTQDDWLDGNTAKHRVILDTWNPERFPDASSSPETSSNEQNGLRHPRQRTGGRHLRAPSDDPVRLQGRHVGEAWQVARGADGVVGSERAGDAHTNPHGNGSKPWPPRVCSSPSATGRRAPTRAAPRAKRVRPPTRC
jgi:hypothetical protein